MTEKKQEPTENPSIVDTLRSNVVADFIEEQDYNDDKLWNYFPLPKDYYEIRDAWGVR